MSIINLYEKSDKLYFVGGIVRDELLGIQSPDIDITYEGDVVEFCKSLDCGEILQINEAFGTVKMSIDSKIIDFASTRKETYPRKGHLPLVERIGCPLKEDVLRRDFTVNTLAKNLKTGEIIDYTGGLEDLQNKLLRILHENSFIDDPTRIIRGLKFAVRFGFSLERQTLNAQERYLDNVNRDMSYKRLKDELISTFNLNLQSAYDIFVEQKMYKLFSDKEVSSVSYSIEELVKKYAKEIKYTWLVYLGGFDLSAFELMRAERKIIEDFQKIQGSFSSDFEIYKAFNGLETESILLYAAINYDAVVKYLDKLRYISIEITGKDLQELGFLPSKRIAECLDYVLSKKLENPVLTKSEELALAVEFM